VPLLSRWYIKVATIYLVGGLLVGVLQALPARLQPSPVLAFTGPAYVHMLVVGWITQPPSPLRFTCGVACLPPGSRPCKSKESLTQPS